MMISKSNTIINNTFSIVGLTTVKGDLQNLRSPNFAKAYCFSGNGTINFGSATLSYIALHGCHFPVGTIISTTGVTPFQTHTVTATNRSSNIVFILDNQTANSGVVFSGNTGEKVISYVQAGAYSTVSWGVSAGQELPDLGQTKRNRVTLNQNGQPSYYLTESNNPNVTLNMKNILKSWVRTEWREILNHYEQTGVLSIRWYPDESNPNESVAGFEMQKSNPTVHGSTLQLVNLSISLRVSV